jgi:hypothetical protein
MAKTKTTLKMEKKCPLCPFKSYALEQMKEHLVKCGIDAMEVTRKQILFGHCFLVRLDLLTFFSWKILWIFLSYPIHMYYLWFTFSTTVNFVSDICDFCYMLSAFVSEHQNDWDEHLPYIAMAYRAAKHETTGITPNYMMLGREHCNVREVFIPIVLMFTDKCGQHRKYCSIIPLDHPI